VAASVDHGNGGENGVRTGWRAADPRALPGAPDRAGAVMPVLICGRVNERLEDGPGWAFAVGVIELADAVIAPATRRGLRLCGDLGY